MARIRFGTDGVRGVANVELTPELVLALGRAVARTITATTFLVGRDTRRSGPMLQAALSAGLASEGADVVDVGVLPTPALAWLSATRNVPAVVISASHNPFADNGIKLFAAGGAKLSAEVEAAIEDELERILDPSAKGPRTLEGHGVGSLRTEPGIGDAYVDHLRLAAGRPHGSTASRLVVDSANGAASALAAEVYERLGAEVVAIGCEPDGTNINAGCGSTSTGTLAGAVVEHRADLGLALDGDADRLLAVDRRGHGGQRGRAPGPVRPRPGRAGPAGRQHRGGHGHDQPRVPPGHGGAGHHRQGDPGRGPPRPGRPGQGRASPSGASSPGTSSSGAWPPPATGC